MIKIDENKFDQALHKISYIRDKLVRADEYLMKALLSDAICLFLDAIDNEERKRESHKAKSI